MAIIDLTVVQYFPMIQGQVATEPIGASGENTLTLTQTLHVSPALESIGQKFRINQRVQIDQSIQKLFVTQILTMGQSATHGPTVHINQTLMMTHGVNGVNPKLTSNKLLLTQLVVLEIDKLTTNELILTQTIGLIHSHVLIINQNLHFVQGVPVYIANPRITLDPVILHGPNDNPPDNAPED